MSDDHSTRAGSLHAMLCSSVMEIDDDDEDIVQIVVEIMNESAIPIGGLQAHLVTDNGQRHEPVEGITSIGPGLTRQFKFEARISAGTWSFEFLGGGQTMTLGPYESDFEFQSEKGRQLGNAIGSSLFSGAFDTNLDAFGNTEERGIISPDSIVMTSYVGENAQGGATKLLRGDAAEVADTEDGPRTPPWMAGGQGTSTEQPEPLPSPPTPSVQTPNDALLTPLTPRTEPPAPTNQTAPSTSDPLLSALAPRSEAPPVEEPRSEALSTDPLLSALSSPPPLPVEEPSADATPPPSGPPSSPPSGPPSGP
ncbi:MAG: hypothetical protein DWC07_04355, partial [Candidatus Poseidoniales archaeon]